MMPAPDSISPCPRCAGPIRSQNWRSFNSIDAVRWTDGAVRGPMLPQFPIMVLCPHCGNPVWSADLKARWYSPSKYAGYNSYGPLAPDDIEAAARWANPFTVADLDEGLRMAAGDPERILAIRRLAWHGSNDPARIVAEQPGELSPEPRPRFTPPSLWRLRFPRQWLTLAMLHLRLWSARLPQRRRSGAVRALIQVLQNGADIPPLSPLLTHVVSLARDAATYEEVLFNLYLDVPNTRHPPAAEPLSPTTAANLMQLVSLLQGNDDSSRLEIAEVLRELGQWEEAAKILAAEFPSDALRTATQLRCLVQHRLSAVDVLW